MVEVAFDELVTTALEIYADYDNHAYTTGLAQVPFFESEMTVPDFVEHTDDYSHPSVMKKNSGPKGLEEWIDMIVGIAWGGYLPMRGYYQPNCQHAMFAVASQWVGFYSVFDKKWKTSGLTALWSIGPIYMLYKGYKGVKGCMFEQDYQYYLSKYYKEEKEEKE